MKNHFINSGKFKFILTVVCLSVLISSYVYLNSKITNDQSTALQTLSTIVILQKQYAGKHQGRFAADFDELIKTENLDEHFTGKKPVVCDYIFEMQVIEAAAGKLPFYSLTADPLAEGWFSTRHFYYDSRGKVVEVTQENRQATAADSPA